MSRAVWLRAATCVPLLWLLGCDQPAAPRATPWRGTDLSGTDLDRDGLAQALSDHTGQARRLDGFRGQLVVLFFGYTQCPDVCPTVLGTMSQAMQQLGEDAHKVQVVFVTIDPERDTQVLLAQYLGAFHAGFLGLRGDAAATARVARTFKVHYEKRPGTSPGQYAMDHSTGSYVLDAHGRLRLYFTHGESSAAIAQDLRQLMAER
ncbi:SCO family protein [Ideonella alba]|uniref:SCO family protein n=1 Tax=Ideonella alba TaxID=2824118 RepID=UPI00287360CC|nr:SCO family protein [Ideonella alba]